MANGIKNYFPNVPQMDSTNASTILPSPYYQYSGQNNLFTPRGYAQNTLVDLLSTRGLLGGDTETEEESSDAVEEAMATFEPIRDSSEQSFFGGMDVNEGDVLGFDDLSELQMIDGLLGGKTVSDNAPKGWNTQHQREFDALVAAGLKPKARWNGNDWYVFAPELKGTAFGEPGTIPFGENKYKGQGFPNLFAGMTGSFNADEVFKKNLAEALQGKSSPEEFTELQPDSFGSKEADIQTQLELQNRLDDMFAKGPITPKDEGSVTAKRGGTVTALRGGTVTAKRPEPEAKPKSMPLKEVITNALNSLTPPKKTAKQIAIESDERDKDKKQAELQRQRQTNLRTAKTKVQKAGGYRGYGF